MAPPESPRLIINADDFGLTPGVNRAIVELHQAAVLSSATLMATGLAFDHAVATAHANPRLAVGCHIVLTDGVPVSDPASIPSLLGPDGRSFRPSLARFVEALLLGRIRPDDIFREALAQVTKLQAAGIPVTHLDTHKHTHLFPGVLRPLLRAAQHAAVAAIRNPFEPPWSLALHHGSRVRQLQVQLLRRLEPGFAARISSRQPPILTPSGSIGISATGHLDQRSLEQILTALPPGVWELVCHPGYHDRDLDRVPTRLRSHREIELQALLTVLPRLRSRVPAPQLIHYGDLRAAAAAGSHDSSAASPPPPSPRSS